MLPPYVYDDVTYVTYVYDDVTYVYLGTCAAARCRRFLLLFLLLLALLLWTHIASSMYV